MKFLLRIILLAVLTVPVFATRTFYIDFNAANDSANGTTTATPWKRCPGMVGFSGTYAHQVGDRFIFKGGVTWTSGVFPITVGNSGNVSNVDYYGVDATYYTGGAWARPIWDDAGAKNRFILHQASYSTFDNIEMKGFYWDNTNLAYGTCTYVSLYGANHVTISNCYFHGWTHASLASGATDALYVIMGSTSAATDSNVITGCTFDDADGDSASGMAVYAEATVRNCVMKNMSNGFLSNQAVQEISGCTVGPINLSYDSGQHENGFESNGSGSLNTSIRIFNNIFFNCYAVTVACDPASGAGGIWTIYLYNNVLWGGANTNTNELFYALPRSMGSSGKIYAWNNTFDMTTRGGYISTHGGNFGTIHAINNHVIGTNATATNTIGSSTLTETNTVHQTLAAANAQGYNSSQTNPYSPTANTNATYNVSIPDTDTGSVTDILGVSRPQASVWDNGAYEFFVAPNPTLVSIATTGTNNSTTVTFTFSDACSQGVGWPGGAGNMTMGATGGAVTLTYTSGTGTTSWIWTASRPIIKGEVLTATYAQPGDGIQATSGGADLASFSGITVANNSSVVVAITVQSGAKLVGAGSF